LETFLSYQVVDDPHHFIGSLRIFVSDTWNDFHYSIFTQDTSNYSGHRLPSVPPQLVVLGLDLLTKPGLYTNITYTYSDHVALNDANTAYAGSYNLLGGRIGYRRMIGNGKFKLNLYAGIDNAFNLKYSLGDDFNAAAGRYYNVAPPRNYYAGLSLGLAF
jgi:iron complex outermembrane receptor protein